MCVMSLVLSINFPALQMKTITKRFPNLSVFLARSQSSGSLSLTIVWLSKLGWGHPSGIVGRKQNTPNKSNLKEVCDNKF